MDRKEQEFLSRLPLKPDGTIDWDEQSKKTEEALEIANAPIRRQRALERSRMIFQVSCGIWMAGVGLFLLLRSPEQEFHTVLLFPTFLASYGTMWLLVNLARLAIFGLISLAATGVRYAWSRVRRG